MPMPKPHTGESHSDFMSRCMSDKVMISDYPDQSQRAAVCMTQWNGKASPGDTSVGCPYGMPGCSMNSSGTPVVGCPMGEADCPMANPNLGTGNPDTTPVATLGMRRAYSVLRVKQVSEDKRIIEGIATTPTPDRYEDVVEPKGMKFSLPLPLLYQHKSAMPIGTVTEAKVSNEGIQVKAKIAPRGTAAYIDEAWSLIKEGLVRGLSIGFRSLEDSYNKETGGIHFLRSEWLELSAVTVPANAEATILNIKAADAPLLAAFGTRAAGSKTVQSPGVSGSTRGRKSMKKTILQQIQEFEASRQAKDARMLAITELAGEEGRTFNDAEKEEFTTLECEVREIDEHLPRLRNLEKAQVSRATPVQQDTTDPSRPAPEPRHHSPIQVARQLPVGTAFARYVIALYEARGNKAQAAEIARQRCPDTPEVEMVLKAEVAVGTTTGTTWASPLYPLATTLYSEFFDLLRPATILGRLPNLRRVPFNVQVPAQTGGGTFGWVGETQPKPVSAMAFSTVALRFNKVAGIVPMSKELLRFSVPSAEAVVTASMVKDAAQFLDTQLLDPTVHVSTNVNPASLTDQVVPKVASGTTAAAFRADLQVVIKTFITANYDPRDIVSLMSASVALNMSLIRNALGQKEFPDLTVNGGSIEGFPVIISEAVGNRIVFLVPNEVLLAEGGIEIDMSQEASLVMDSAPGASPMTTTLVSLYQRNLVAIRTEQFVTWQKARTTTCQYISNAVYTG